jgi:hypothetical protein
MEETGIRLIHWCEAWEEPGIRRLQWCEGQVGARGMEAPMVL